MTTETVDRKKHEEERSKAVGFGMVVYTGGIVAATAIFIFFILTAFPESAYFIRFLMVIAALCVGASALAFRYALENWAVYGSHRKAAIFFYYGEIFLVGLNTIVSFAALLYRFSGNKLPEWVAWYEPFTIITIAYVILAWGTLFVLDPKAKAKARQLQVLLDFDNQVIDGMSDYLKSEDGLLAIQENANERIRQNFSVNDNSPKPWISRGQNTGPTTPGIPASPGSSVSVCSHCGTRNAPGASFCQACGAPFAPSAPTPPASPSGSARPKLPKPGRYYSLEDLLAFLDLTREDAISTVRRLAITSTQDAYGALRPYLPEDMTQDNFMAVFCELLGVAPTWGAVSIPAPVGAGNNGAGSHSRP